MAIGVGKKTNGRRFTGGGPRPDLKEMKRREAKERDEAWRKLSPKEQLADLDRRLGKGLGAAKQRARLQALINAPKRQKDEPQEKAHVKAKDRRAKEQAERPSH